MNYPNYKKQYLFCVLSLKTSLFCFIALFCLACSQTEIKQVDKQKTPFAHITDNSVRTILQKSIAKHGGLDTWQAKKKLSYSKDFSLLKENGELEKKFQQKHSYEYKPLKITINSTENGQVIQTVLKNGTYSRTQDGKVLDLPKNKLQKAVNTSLYVIGIPFKLLDEGAKITHIGVDTVLNKAADVLEVRYDTKQYVNHSSNDIWRYYFDQTDGTVLANWVQTDDHANLVENLTFEKVGGILFNKQRKSWRLDSLGNKAYLRADYLYDNFDLE